MIGKTILHYKILKKLGEGGMGTVYLAEDMELERKAALKFLPHFISKNSEEKKRFKIEAKAAAALNHPNIATIYSIEESLDKTFLIMEYVEGKSLKEIISFFSQMEDKRGLPINDIINYSEQIAEGLVAAHKKGIVHRDIKSSNIMITNDGTVKIMDFGLAKIGKSAHLTKAGTTVGTVEYMSPEQAKGEEVDYRTDIWSFGVVLYEMMTGELPFKGEYDQAIIYSILNEQPKFPSDLSVRFKNVMNKMLNKDSPERMKKIKS